MKIQGHIIIRRKAKNGNNGQDALLYELMPSAQVINLSNEGVFSSIFVTCSVKKIQGSTLVMLTSASLLSVEGLRLSYTMDDGSDGDTVIAPTTKVYPKSSISYINFILKKDGTIIDKKTIQICNDGKDGEGMDGKPGYTYRPRGLFKQGNSYIYNDEYRDVVIHKFSGVAHVFRVRNKGTTVTAAPTSTAGDSNWEAANELSFVATDFVLARQIHANEIDGTHLEVIDGKFTGSIATPPVVLTGNGNVTLDFATGFNFAAFANTGERRFILPTNKMYNGVNCIIAHLGGYDIEIEVDNGNIRCGSSSTRTLILPGYGMAYLYSVLPNPDNDKVIWYVLNNSSFTITSNGVTFKKQEYDYTI